MRNVLATALAGTLLFGGIAGAQQEEAYDYWQQQRQMIRQGQQAIFMCNGLFTSNRTIEQVFAQELAFLPEPVGTPEGGDYEVGHRAPGGGQSATGTARRRCGPRSARESAA